MLCVRARRVTLLTCVQGWQGPTLLPARPPGTPLFSTARPPDGGLWGQRFPSAPSWDFFSGSHGPRVTLKPTAPRGGGLVGRRSPPWSRSPAGPLPSTADVPPAPPALAAVSCGPCAASVVSPGVCGRPFPSVWPPVLPLLGMWRRGWSLLLGARPSLPCVFQCQHRAGVPAACGHTGLCWVLCCP